MQDTKRKYGTYYEIFLISEERKKIERAIKNFFDLYSKDSFSIMTPNKESYI